MGYPSCVQLPRRRGSPGTISEKYGQRNKCRKKLPTISTAWVRRTTVTDRQQTDGRAIAYSKRELTFTKCAAPGSSLRAVIRRSSQITRTVCSRHACVVTAQSPGYCCCDCQSTTETWCDTRKRIRRTANITTVNTLAEQTDVTAIGRRVHVTEVNTTITTH